MNNFSAINIFNTNIRHLSGPRLIEKGRSLVTLINGNAFYPLSSWLNDIRLKFWKKPISDQDTSQLMLFCLGDGYSLHFIKKMDPHFTKLGNCKERRKTSKTSFLLRFLHEQYWLWITHLVLFWFTPRKMALFEWTS